MATNIWVNHKSGNDCCLTAPSHYLNKCWHTIRGSVTFTSEQIRRKCWRYQSAIWVWKSHITQRFGVEILAFELDICPEFISGLINCATGVYHAVITMTSQWARWRPKSPASPLFTQPFIQTQIKRNIKASRHWTLCGEFTGDRWIPRTNGQLRGKCFRHHDFILPGQYHHIHHIG